MAPAADPEVESNLEQEYKFDVDPDFDPPDLRGLVGRTERLAEQHMTTTYFDTADLRLWGQGITLRYRAIVPSGSTMVAAVEGPGGPAAPSGKWTLKLPEGEGPGPDAAGMASRSELNWKGSAGDLPAEARAIVAGLVRRAPVSEITKLSTTRRRLLLHGPEAPWAEIDDDLATVVEGSEKGLRFRQLELELMPDAAPPDGLLAAVVAALRAAGAGASGRSKFALAAGVPDRPVGPPPRAADATGMVARQLSAGLDRLLAQDYRLRIPDEGRGPDPEAVHQARVATRRLRSDLLTFSAVLDPVWAKNVRADLKWIGALLGRLRDADVLIALLRRHDDPDDTDAVAALIRLVEADRHLDAEELAEVLTGTRYVEMLDRLAAASARPPLVHSDVGEADLRLLSARMVRPRLHALEEEIAGLGPRPGHRQLHHVRIRSKRLRYAAEAVEPYVGRPAARTAASARELQSRLGEINDAANAVHRLRELACHPSATPSVAFVAGRLAGRAEAGLDDARRRWRPPARRLAARRARRWLA